jgi:hypothetical protein
LGENVDNSILYEIPERFETERLIIRAPLSADGILVNEAIRESIEELRPWMPVGKRNSTSGRNRDKH